MATDGSERFVLLNELGEDFAARYRRGERPALQEYIDRHPALADDIREFFPAMAEMEQVKDDNQQAEAPAAAAPLPALERLGDFRILREIGRGGMGVVYEAEQVSLGRHVALKVLPQKLLADARTKQRFEREAKAAAKLHHTNIVPVFGVGEQDGLPYYVMQFIHGLGLDQVLKELQQLPPGAKGSDCAPKRSGGELRITPRDVSAADVARSLLTGRFVLAADVAVGQASDPARSRPDRKPAPPANAPAAGADATVDLGRRPAAAAAVVPAAANNATGAYAPAAAPAATAPPSTPIPGRLSDTFSLSASSVVLAGTAPGSGQKSLTYWQSVARIGVQVADALDYAHKQGVQHRDIKPSNLLLDTGGSVWIADFGLAKADDQQNLTQTGDILGTLRYMPPEAFEGRTDARGDIYALGLTLYELLCLRPAFDERERHRLIKQVMAAEPARLDRLNRAVPRDLVTIVHKAIERDPAHRYASAGALAADLRRFLADEPIQARRQTHLERSARWARHNPGVAVLGGVLAAVLVLATVASLLAAGYFNRLRKEATAERARAVEQRQVAQEQTQVAQEQTQVANQRAEDLAWEDYVNRVARAYREVQDDNVALAEDLLHGCPSERRGWEWHYVKRLCHPERLSVEVPAGSLSAIAFSPDGRVIATGSGGQFSRGKGGSNVECWDRETGQRRPTLHRTENVIWGLAFSPDGTKLALGGTKPQVEVRDARTGAVRWSKHEPKLPQAMSIAFSPDGKALAVGFGQYSQQAAFQVKIYEVETGRETVAFPGPRGGVNHLAFHPDGRHLAVAGAQVVEIWEVGEKPGFSKETGFLTHAKKVHELRGHSKWVYGVAYSPDGKWLATGGWDRTIKLRDATSGEERLTIFAHDGFVLALAFSPDSRSLVSTSEDRSVRLWEVPSGRPLGVLHGHADFVQAVAFAPDGRELASGGMEGTMKVWDRRSSVPVVFDGHTGWVGRLWYRRDGRRVITAPIAHQVAGETTKGWDPSTGELDPALTGIDPSKLGDEYLPPVEFPPNYGPPRAVTSPDGKLIARVWAGSVDRPMADRSKEYASNSVEVLDAKSGRVLHTLIGHTAEVRGLAFSPDGRRIATSSWDRTIKLWDPDTGREVFTLRGHTAGLLVVAFSPDGRRLVSGGIDFTARVWDATPLPAEVLRAQDARYQRKRQALAELARAVEDSERAENLAKSGQWDLAAAAFGKFVEQEPDNLVLRQSQIRALLEANDVAGARRACEDLLKRSANATTTDLALANNVVWSCVLTPDAVTDPGAPVRLAEAALKLHLVAGREGSDRLRILGAALYRAGRFAEASRSLEESHQNRGDDGDPRGFAFLALAHHRLGHRAEAKRWLDQLAAYRPKEGPGFSWDDVEIDILRREAESLILGSRPAASPIVPSAPGK